MYLYILNSLNFDFKKTPVETKNISNMKSKFLEYVSYRVYIVAFMIQRILVLINDVIKNIRN